MGKKQQTKPNPTEGEKPKRKHRFGKVNNKISPDLQV